VDPRMMLFGLYLFFGVLLALLGVPLILARVPPNRWYGFRVRRTLSDPSVWYAANRYSGWWMLAAGVVSAVVAAAGYVAPLGFVPYALTCGGVAVAAVAVGVVFSFRHLGRLPAGAGR
jgi:hypothetical protein